MGDTHWKLQWIPPLRHSFCHEETYYLYYMYLCLFKLCDKIFSFVTNPFLSDKSNGFRHVTHFVTKRHIIYMSLKIVWQNVLLCHKPISQWGEQWIQPLFHSSCHEKKMYPMSKGPSASDEFFNDGFSLFCCVCHIEMAPPMKSLFT